MQRSTRLIVGVVAPLATLALVIGPVLVAMGSLPDPIAIGWGGDGTARTSSSPGGFLLIQAIGGGVCAALFVGSGLKRWAMPAWNGMLAVLAAAVAPVLAVVSLNVVLANRGQTDWQAVPEPGLAWLAAAMVLPFVAVAGVGWLMRDTFLTSSPTSGAEATAGLTLGEAESAAWHSTASARWPRTAAGLMFVVAVLFLVAGVFALGGLGIVLSLSLLAIALLMMALSSVAVSIDRRGLSVRYGPFPWPVSKIPLTAIEVADALDVRPMAHGGWGYRGSRKFFGKAAVVIRGGEGIRLRLRDGTEFVVTVDDADRGAGVLNDLRSSLA